MQIENFLKIIEQALPPQTAMDGDRIGLQIQGGNKELTRLLVTMEVNAEVIKEAEELKADTIITFHPLIFHPLVSIQENDRTGKLTAEIIRKSINLISIHTNFDAFDRGTSRIFSEKLGLDYVSFLKENPTVPGFGTGVLAKPKNQLTDFELVQKISEICYSPVRYCSGKGKDIGLVAIVCGSGISFINDALNSRADAFITADISYHNFHRVEGKLMLADPGHYEMEQFVPEAMYQLFISILPEYLHRNIFLSGIHTNPVCYYPQTENYINKQKKYLINNREVK